jgi:hypothetical protein
MDDQSPAAFLVFGDLHGRVLPAFRFASYWSRRHRRPAQGLLQVGDLGYFPDPATIDKATLRHAKDDPLELGTLDIVSPNRLADAVFEGDPHAPPGLWFTAGNHEDFAVMERLADNGREPEFTVDAYVRVRGIKDGRVKRFGCGLSVGAVWGVDGDGPHGRKNLPPRGYIREAAVSRLVGQEFDVLLTHDAPADAKRAGYGSEYLRALIGLRQPAFAFFGHYKGDGGRVDRDFGQTAVYHLAGFELRTRSGQPEPGSVGVLERAGRGWSFALVSDEELAPFTRHNWKWV